MYARALLGERILSLIISLIQAFEPESFNFSSPYLFDIVSHEGVYPER